MFTYISASMAQLTSYLLLKISIANFFCFYSFINILFTHLFKWCKKLPSACDTWWTWRPYFAQIEFWELESLIKCFKLLLMRGSCGSFKVCITLFSLRSIHIFFFFYHQTLCSYTFFLWVFVGNFHLTTVDLEEEKKGTWIKKSVVALVNIFSYQAKDI